MGILEAGAQGLLQALALAVWRIGRIEEKWATDVRSS
jgi:hypothetical protein